MITESKPGSPEEVLAHFGKKGMKWGVRRTPPSGSRSAVTSKFNKKNPSSGAKADAIRLARAKSNVNFQKAYKVKRGTKAERKAAKLTYLKSPDRATALRMTRGEKVVTGILAGVFAPTIIVPVAAGVGAGGQYAFRRHVEKKQARGGYK